MAIHSIEPHDPGEDTLGVTGQALSNIYQLAPRSPGARVVILTSSFAALILALAYASAYSAWLSSYNSQPLITAYSDIKHRTVGAWKVDMGVLNPRDFKGLVLLAWDTDADEANLLERLRNQTVDTLIFDVLFVEATVSQMCEFVSVGDIFAPSPMGWVFPPNSTDEYILGFDSLIGQLNGNGFIRELA